VKSRFCWTFVVLRKWGSFGLDISDEKKRFKQETTEKTEKKTISACAPPSVVPCGAGLSLVLSSSSFFFSFFTDFAPLRLKKLFKGIPARSCQERNFILEKPTLSPEGIFPCAFHGYMVK
jgi:hypothetical protein